MNYQSSKPLSGLSPGQRAVLQADAPDTAHPLLTLHPQPPTNSAGIIGSSETRVGSATHHALTQTSRPCIGNKECSSLLVVYYTYTTTTTTSPSLLTLALQSVCFLPLLPTKKNTPNLISTSKPPTARIFSSLEGSPSPSIWASGAPYPRSLW